MYIVLRFLFSKIVIFIKIFMSGMGRVWFLLVMLKIILKFMFMVWFEGLFRFG